MNFKKLVIVNLILVVIMVFGLCLPAAAAEEKEWKTLVIGVAAGASGMDIDFHSGRARHFITRNTSAAPLAYPSKEMGENYISDFSQLVGDLAESWEVSENWDSITIKLKEGVLSSAGNELTADDVIYKFQRSEALQGVNWGLSSMALLINSADAIEKIDKYTYRINASGPTALIEQFQAHDMSVLFDSTEYKKHATDSDPWSTEWASKNFIGFGPYKIVEWVPGEKEVWELNENYYAPETITGNINKVIFLEIPDSTSRLALLSSGEIDIALDMSASELQNLATVPGVRVDTHQGNHIFWMQFPIGNEATPQYKDVNVRKAIQLAVPYEDILERAYLGFATQMNTFVSPMYPGHDEIASVWTTTTDVDKAREYMAQSAYPDGFDTKVYFDGSIEGQEETGILIKAALKEIGINVELVKLQTGDYNTRAFEGQGFDGMNLYREQVGMPTAAFHTFLYLIKGHCCAPGLYQCDDIDGLYAKQISSIGQEDLQIELQKEIENIAWNENPTGAPLGYLGYQVAVRDNIKGWWWQSLNELLFQKLIKE